MPPTDKAFSHLVYGEEAVLENVVCQRPKLLLMDESTNHLDMDMRHVLMSRQGIRAFTFTAASESDTARREGAP